MTSRRLMPKAVSLADLIRARKIAADIVADYGETFLPIFQRLDKEVTDAVGEDRALERALSIAGDS